MTGKPVKLVNALMKISGTMRRIPTKDLREVEGLNAFFIVSALSGSTIGNLFSTHPPCREEGAKAHGDGGFHESNFFRRFITTTIFIVDYELDHSKAQWHRSIYSVSRDRSADRL